MERFYCSYFVVQLHYIMAILYRYYGTHTYIIHTAFPAALDLPTLAGKGNLEVLSFTTRV